MPKIEGCKCTCTPVLSLSLWFYIYNSLVCPFTQQWSPQVNPLFFTRQRKKCRYFFTKKKKEFFLKPADTQCISNHFIRSCSILSVAHVTYVLIKKQSGCHSSETRSLIIGTFFKTSEKYRIALTVLRFPLIWREKSFDILKNTFFFLKAGGTITDYF